MRPDQLVKDGPILVSACLLGVRCRFDGDSKHNPAVLELCSRVQFIPICPEQLAGLPTPRDRHECLNGAVVSEHGQDATEIFQRGAAEVLRIATLIGCKVALLKARSPSCGSGTIYDGSFSGALIPGDGVAATALKRIGVMVLTEEDIL